jgi:sugar phosphate isomerase/epimerase
VSEDADQARATDRFAELCDAAARASACALRWNSCASARCRRSKPPPRLVNAAARSNAGVLVDALHLARSGGTPAAVAALPRERIAYMQLCDAPRQSPPVDDLAREARHDRLHAGEGELWLDELFALAADDVAISVEVPRSADAARSFRERAVIAGDLARAYLAHRPHRK